MIGQGGGDLPKDLDQLSDILSSQLRSNCLLGIPDTRKPGPSDVRAVREEFDEIFDLGQLLKH